MSAFIVSPGCLHGAVRALLPRSANYRALTLLGRRLLAMNIDAVRQRYPDDAPGDLPGPVPNPKPEEYEYDSLFTASPEQLLVSLKCLQYQCSEGDVPERPLFKRVERRIEAMKRTINTDSPAYQAAEWDAE